MKELRDLKYLTMYDIQPIKTIHDIQPISDPFARRPRRLVWVSWLEGDLRRQGYEASKVDSRKPRKHIDLGIVDWKDRLCRRALRPSIDSLFLEDFSRNVGNSRQKLTKTG